MAAVSSDEEGEMNFPFAEEELIESPINLYYSPNNTVNAVIHLFDRAGAFEEGKENRYCDLGCGDGRVVIAMAQNKGVKGLGVDNSDKNVEICRENANRLNLSSLCSFEKQDLASFQIPPSVNLSSVYLTKEALDKFGPIWMKWLKEGKERNERKLFITTLYHPKGWENLDSLSDPLFKLFLFDNFHDNFSTSSFPSSSHSNRK